MQTILAVDDEASVCQAYRMILSDRYNVLLAGSGAEAFTIIDDAHVDLILLDQIMPGMTGTDVLRELRRRNETMPVIMVTASGAVPSVVEAMKLGAREYVLKPFDVDEIVLVVERTLAEQRDRQELNALREAGTCGFGSIVGESSAVMQTLTLIHQAAKVDSTVLITGESGTGKDLAARAIHSSGKRAEEAFVAVSCCAIPEPLVESELYGHERGAFTGATERRIGKMQVADRGTLFLDELGEMPLEAQAKLLRVLQDGRFYPVGSSKVIEVDTRFVCATNRNLRDAIAQGRFREDLFYRINVIPIEMPPLRQRREDIPLLVNHFIGKHAPRANARTHAFSLKAMSQLASYHWPGNIRELENTIERVLVYHGHHDVIGPEHLTGILPGTLTDDTSQLTEFEGLSLADATGRLERRLILRALERSNQVQSRAAELLGTTRRILKYKMDQLGIESAAEDAEQPRSNSA
ncbi:MAG: sigma-54-dependent Fis family transcriptional regulator [Candidatus Hydrogenedentes bacterium]|nr:sigma-54-dependent Fis family transcriptional regulator [Candidatus Hydrogenedentota bacterium]